jgi:hypothetical protein
MGAQRIGTIPDDELVTFAILDVIFPAARRGSRCALCVEKTMAANAGPFSAAIVVADTCRRGRLHVRALRLKWSRMCFNFLSRVSAGSEVSEDSQFGALSSHGP